MKKVLLIILYAIFFNVSTINAFPVLAIDLSYTHIGSASYLITAKVYRDCNSVSPGAIFSVRCVSSQNMSYTYTANLNLVSSLGQEVTPICNQSSSYCRNGNINGVDLYVYQKVLNLAPQDSWTIEPLFHFCRLGVTTITGSSCSNLYTEVVINTLNAQVNSSPVISNHLLYEVNTNQLVKYNIGAVDPDGDRLVYSFYTPTTSSTGTILNYNNPFSANNFLSSSTPITLDSLTGEITFTPNAALTTLFGIKIDEWRTINGVLVKIGTIYHEEALKVTASNSYIPVLSGMNFLNLPTYNINDTVYYTEVYAEDSVSFTIAGFDADTTYQAQIFSIDWNQGISGASFNVYNNSTDSTFARFDWKTSILDISTDAKSFSVIIQDSACPYNLRQVYTYSLKVIPPALNIGSDTTICLSQHITLDADSGAYNYLWSTGDTTQTIAINGALLGLGIYSYSVARTGYGQVLYDTLVVTIDACIGMFEKIETEIVRVFPNPNNGVFEIEIKSQFNKDYNLSIYNSVGILVYSQQFDNTKQEPRFEINLSNQQKGVYYLQISNQEKISIKKVIIN